MTMAGPVTAPGFTDVFVGRGGQLELFARGLADRRCRGFVVAGSAGVGKSRLVEECLAWAEGTGLRVARATASAAARSVPLGAIAHLVPAGVDLSDPVVGFAAAARRLAGPDGRALVLLIDDLHLLDAASAVLLRQLMDAGVVRLLGTLCTGAPVGEAVDALCRGDTVWRVELAELDRGEAEELLRAVLGGPVAQWAVRELHAACGGNVLYLRELVTGALERGALVSDGEIWQLERGPVRGTARLAELIGARLAAAGGAARPVLELLALCQPLPLADLEQAASPAVVAALESAGLVRVGLDGRRTSVALAHPLYGEVLRAELPVLRRRELLVRQAGRVEARGLKRRDDALHVASWRLAATGTADPAMLVRAAAQARYAHDYRQAGLLLGALPEEHHTTATRLMLGETYFELGDPQRAEAVLAVAAAGAASEQDRLAVAMARSFNLFWGAAQPDDALKVIDAARAQVTTADGLRILDHNEGSMRIASGEPVRGLALLEDLEEDIHQAPDPVAWLTGAMMKPLGLELVGRTGDAVAWAERAHAAHLTVGHQTLCPHPAVQLTLVNHALSSHGRLAEAREAGLRGYAELAGASTTPVHQIWLAFSLGRTEWLAGHPASARRWYAEAAALARTHQHLRPLGPALSGLAACAAVLGDLDAAEQACAEARNCLWPDVFAGEELLGEAWLHAARGHFAQARTVLTGAARRACAAGLVTPEAMLLTDVARLGGAKEVSGRLSELARHSDSTLTRAGARLAAALAADAPDQLLAVAAVFEQAGADLQAAEAAAAAACAWQRAARPRRATAAAGRAAALAGRCERARTALLTAAAPTAALTAREREVALLAAAGTRSKDIADGLQLSVRTVNNHLQHAYAKLGVTTRRELATALDRRVQADAGGLTELLKSDTAQPSGSRTSA
ncbi:helix-turn-helix transcriptional regulator [Streptomyces sp. NPDC029004]|uniref:helix-turn-helix transcriptional regulator n=1 Tax=Streptomyces sp. NPDC029004 TaxID=3154490 RepID=UPI0033E5D7E9